MYADCVIFVTFCKYRYGIRNEWCFPSIIRQVNLFLEIRSVLTYVRRDSCSLLYAEAGCCLFYPHFTGFTSDVYLVALFRFPRYTDLITFETCCLSTRINTIKFVVFD